MENQSNPTRSDQIGQMAKTGATVFSWYKFLRGVVVTVVFTIIFIFLWRNGVPGYIVFPFIILILFLNFGEFIQAKKVASLDMDVRASTNYNSNVEIISVSPEESVVFQLPGVMRAGWGIRSTTGMSGVGEVRHPENTLILTNKNVLLLYIPLSGADKVITGTDLGVVNWLLASKDIANKLSEMLQSQTLDQIFKSDQRNFGISLENLAKVDFGSWTQTISLLTKSGQKYSYSVRNKEDYEKAKQVFS